MGLTSKLPWTVNILLWNNQWKYKRKIKNNLELWTIVAYITYKPDIYANDGHRLFSEECSVWTGTHMLLNGIKNGKQSSKNNNSIP